MNPNELVPVLLCNTGLSPSGQVQQVINTLLEEQMVEHNRVVFAALECLVKDLCEARDKWADGKYHEAGAKRVAILDSIS